MTPDTLLLRQIHPSFIQDGRVTSHMRWTHAASQRDYSERLDGLISGVSPFTGHLYSI